MGRNQHLNIYQDTYRFCREIFRLKQKFPKTLKYDLGEKLGTSALNVMKHIIVANGSKEKAKPLRAMALEIDSLWVFLRMAYDFQAISQGEFQVVSEILFEISEQNKKWLAWSVKTNTEPTARGEFQKDIDLGDAVK